MSIYRKRVIISVDLGDKSSADAHERKAALEQIAAESGFFWNDKPSIGRWLVNLADERRTEK